MNQQKHNTYNGTYEKTNRTFIPKLIVHGIAKVHKVQNQEKQFESLFDARSVFADSNGDSGLDFIGNSWTSGVVFLLFIIHRLNLKLISISIALF